MRKILMFGTMLGVASAALAFGGMFNHGSKSTTYKGGVDAIGVHFGGEKKTDSQPEEICAADKKCGDGCCRGDNVCKQDPNSGEYQCCNDYKCCNTNEVAYKKPWAYECCQGNVYEVILSGHPYNICCPKNKQVACTGYRDEECIWYSCCGENDTRYCKSRHSGVCDPTGWECCSGTVTPGEGDFDSDICNE